MVLGAALTALFVVSLLVYTNRAAAQASSGNLVPPMTMVYEVYGPSISVGERSIEPFKELHRLEYQSETEWVDTVIESPSVDLGRYGVGSNVGSYTRLDGRAIDEYDAMDGSMEESAVSEDSIFVPNSAFAYALARFHRRHPGALDIPSSQQCDSVLQRRLRREWQRLTPSTTPRGSRHPK